MQLEKMTMRYQVERACSYQKAIVGAEIVVTLEPGDKMEAVFTAGMKRLAVMGDAEADGAIKDTCYKASMDHN